MPASRSFDAGELRALPPEPFCRVVVLGLPGGGARPALEEVTTACDAISAATRLTSAMSVRSAYRTRCAALGATARNRRSAASPRARSRAIRTSRAPWRQASRPRLRRCAGDDVSLSFQIDPLRAHCSLIAQCRPALAPRATIDPMLRADGAGRSICTHARHDPCPQHHGCARPAPIQRCTRKQRDNFKCFGRISTPTARAPVTGRGDLV